LPKVAVTGRATGLAPGEPSQSVSLTRAALPMFRSPTEVPREKGPTAVNELYVAPTRLVDRAGARERLPAVNGATAFVPQSAGSFEATQAATLGFADTVPAARIDLARSKASKSSSPALAGFDKAMAAQRAALLQQRERPMFDGATLLAVIQAEAQNAVASVRATTRAARSTSASATKRSVAAVQVQHGNTVASLRARHNNASRALDAVYDELIGRSHAVLDVRSLADAPATSVLATAATGAAQAVSTAAACSSAIASGLRGPEASAAPQFDFESNGWERVQIGMAVFYRPPPDAQRITMGKVSFNNYKSPTDPSAYRSEGGPAQWETGNGRAATGGSYESYASDIAVQVASAVGEQYASEILSAGEQVAGDMRALAEQAHDSMVGENLARAEALENERYAAQAGLQRTLDQSILVASGIASGQIAALEQSDANVDAELSEHEARVLAATQGAAGQAKAALAHTSAEGQRVWTAQVDALIDELDARQRQAHVDAAAQADPDEAGLTRYLQSVLEGTQSMCRDGQRSLATVKKAYGDHARGRFGELTAGLGDDARGYATGMDGLMSELVGNVGGLAFSQELEDVDTSFDRASRGMVQSTRERLKQALGPNPYYELKARVEQQLSSGSRKFGAAINDAVRGIPKAVDEAARKAVHESIGTKGEFIGKIIALAFVNLAMAVVMVVVTVFTLGIGSGLVALGFSAINTGFLAAIFLAVVGTLVAVITKVLSDAIEGKLTNPSPDLWKEYLIEMGTGFVTGLFGAIGASVGGLAGPLMKLLKSVIQPLTKLFTFAKMVLETAIGLVVDFVALPIYWALSESIDGDLSAQSFRDYLSKPANVASWLVPNLLGPAVALVKLVHKGLKWLSGKLRGMAGPTLDSLPMVQNPVYGKVRELQGPAMDAKLRKLAHRRKIDIRDLYSPFVEFDASNLITFTQGKVSYFVTYFATDKAFAKYLTPEEANELAELVVPPVYSEQLLQSADEIAERFAGSL
jgi:hypothetical protein